MLWTAASAVPRKRARARGKTDAATLRGCVAGIMAKTESGRVSSEVREMCSLPTESSKNATQLYSLELDTQAAGVFVPSRPRASYGDDCLCAGLSVCGSLDINGNHLVILARGC